MQTLVCHIWSRCRQVLGKSTRRCLSRVQSTSSRESVPRTGLLQEQAVSQFLRDVSGAVQGLAAEAHLLRERCANIMRLADVLLVVGSLCWLQVTEAHCVPRDVETVMTHAGWATWRRTWRR